MRNMSSSCASLRSGCCLANKYIIKVIKSPYFITVGELAHFFEICLPNVGET